MVKLREHNHTSTQRVHHASYLDLKSNRLDLKSVMKG